MTAETGALDLDAIEWHHVEISNAGGTPFCRSDGIKWPCDAVRLIAEVRQLRAVNAALMDGDLMAQFRESLASAARGEPGIPFRELVEDARLRAMLRSTTATAHVALGHEGTPLECEGLLCAAAVAMLPEWAAEVLTE